MDAGPPDSTNLEDQEWVRRASKRDVDARNRLAAKYWPPLNRFLNRLLRPEDAEDVALDSLMHALESIANGRYDPEKGAFKNWLFTIARRRSLDLLRSRRVQVPVEDWLAWCDESRPGIHEAFWDCVGRIPADKWEWVLLRDVDRVSLEELAQMLGWAKASTSTRLSEIRAALAACLKEKGYDLWTKKNRV